jgi:hypothetical protein
MKGIIANQSTFCGQCRQGTEQSFTLEHGSDYIILEVIRANEKKRRSRVKWRKNMLPITFPTSGISPRLQT